MTVVVPNVPTPVPSRTDPTNFAVRADAYHTALPLTVDALNRQNAENNSINVSVNAASTSATAAKLAAESAASTAAAANGGQLWVSGTTYAANFLVYSPLTRRSYRRLVAGAGTTDPSLDTANWGALSTVVEQTDIGTAPNQVPLNQYLGALAYTDAVSQALLPGAGITLGTGSICKVDYSNMSGVKRIIALVDFRGLRVGSTAGDIIGSESTTINGVKQPAYVFQVPTGFTALGGYLRCLELPAGSTGLSSVGLFSATEGTGLQDDAITGLTETSLVATATQALGTTAFFSAAPAESSYLYFVCGATAGTYTAGRFLVEVFGV